jgi:hypothetical protein
MPQHRRDDLLFFSKPGTLRWNAMHARKVSLVARVRLKREWIVELRVMVRDWKGISLVRDGAMISLHQSAEKSQRFSLGIWDASQALGSILRLALVLVG